MLAADPRGASSVAFRGHRFESGVAPVCGAPVPRRISNSFERPASGTNYSWRSGRAGPLCPGISDINLLHYCQGIIYVDAQISSRAFDLGVTKQELDSPKIARTPVDQSCFRASKRTRSEEPWI